MARISLATEIPGNNWTTPYVPNEGIDAGRIDESLIATLNSETNLAIIGADAWQTSSQLAFKNIAVSAGFPKDTVRQIRDVVGVLAVVTTSQVGKMISELTFEAIGVAVDLIAAIPIVGPIVKAVVRFARMLVGLSRKQDQGYRVAEQLPELLNWEEVVDEAATNALLRQLTGMDWTSIFMPTHGGGWALHDASNGYYGKGTELVGGAGFMPGTERSARVAQATFQQTAVAGSHRDEWLPISQNTGSFFPGVNNIGMILDQQVQKPQAQMYCVDTVAIERAWDEYFRGYLSLAARVFHGQETTSKLSKLDATHRRQVGESLAIPLLVRRGTKKIGVTRGWQPGMDFSNPFMTFIKPWAERLRRRQFKYTETLVVAYASIESGAITANPILKEKFVEMRKLLLTHPARMKVKMADVLDDDYRAALQESRRDWRPDSFQAAPARAFTAVGSGREGALPPGGGAPFDGDAAGKANPLLYVAAVGLAAATYYKFGR